MKNLKFVVFNTNNTYGNTMGGAGKANRLKIAEEVGFDLNRLFMTMKTQERGTIYTLKSEDLANYEDLYDYNQYVDTAKVTPNTPGVAIGFNIYDGANIVTMNTKTMEATSTFCPGTHIDAEVPKSIAEITGGNPEDIIVDVSPFAYELPLFNPNDKNYTPEYVNNGKVWDGALHRDKNTNILYLNQLKAIKKQLLASGIKEDNINWGEDSFYTTDANGNFLYPSLQRTRMVPDLAHPGQFLIDPETGTYLQDDSQKGSYMHGVALLEETKEPYTNENIKVYTYESVRRR